MAQLPLFTTFSNQNFVQMSSQWKSLLDPVLANPILNGHLISQIKLINGSTTIDHLLGRRMVGWFLTDIDGVGTVYRAASLPFNDKTFILVSNASMNVSIWVF